MDPLDQRIVVVGAGQAAQSCAARLRALGHAGPLTLLGAEAAPPYQRPPLSKGYLLGETARERLFLRPRAWYAQNDIDLRLGAEATAIDPAARTVTAAGEAHPYDALVLATGGRPRQLSEAQGHALRGHYTIRTIACIDAFEPLVREGARLLVVGGGYIGLEAAAVARKRGMHVTVVEMGPRILGRVASEDTADWFRALHVAQGVEVLEGVGLETLIGAGGAATGARLTDGREVPLDLCLVGIGVEPLTPIATLAGCEQTSGVTVDALGRTSVPGIWAAGDAASLPHDGRHVRLENVQNAIDQAEAVAANLLGARAPYVPEPWFWSDQYDVKLQIAGLNTGHDRVVIRQDGAARSHWHYAGARLVSVDAMNAPRDYMTAKRLIAEGRSPDPAAVADAAAPVKRLLA